jgi:hypothetical protein
VTIDDKLAALAARCEAPQFGPDGVCPACCFTRRVTTRIAATPMKGGAAPALDGHVESTLAICAYRQRLVTPLLELHEMSNPGLRPGLTGGVTEAELIKLAFATTPSEERQAFVTLIETLYEQHVRAPA